MANFTNNLCTNPSFEHDLSGVTPLPGTEVIQDELFPQFGLFSLHAKCDGKLVGEGLQFAPTIIPYGTIAVSLYIGAWVSPADSLRVSVNSAVYGVLAQQDVTVGAPMARINFENLTVVINDQIFIEIVTKKPLKCDFWVDAIQVEGPNGNVTPYCDGDQDGCFWTGTPHESASYRLAQFGTGARGRAVFGGAANFIVEGEVFPTSGSASSKFTARATPIPQNPVASFTDFAIYELTDPDPAQTYVSWNNAGTSSGHTGYNRVYGCFVPPLDYPNSTGNNTWNRAAFAAVGFQWANIAATQAQDFTDIQLEFMPVNGTGSATLNPSAYDTPRAIHTIIHPARLNYITNPSFETSTAGWTALGTGTLSQDTTKAAPVSVVDDEVTETAGTASLKVVVNANQDGCQISITNLMAGETYTVSCYITVNTGLADLELSCSGAFGSLLGSGYPYAGTATVGYGQGPYGGEALGGTSNYGQGNYGQGTFGTPVTPNDLPTGVWFRPSATFVASDATVTFKIMGIASSDVAYPTTFWVDAVLCEPGSLVGAYFDGGFGTDYFWEGQIANGVVGTAPSPNLSRSYYYNQYYVKSQAVLNTLAKHTPLGLNYTTPVYTQPPTQ